MLRCGVLLVLLALPALARGEAPPLSLRRAALVVLSEELSTAVQAYSGAALARTAAMSGVDEGAVRLRLTALLDTLAQQRRQKSAGWKKLIALRGEISSKRAVRFLENLEIVGRRILQSSGDYLPGGSVRWAALQARIPFESGRAYLLRMVHSVLDQGGAARAFNLVVGGHTNKFELNKDPLFIFFATRDEAFIEEKVREIQRFIIPRLVRELPQSEAVKWAVRQRQSNVLLEPDFHLVLGIDNLSFTGSNADLRPCIEATLELLRPPDGVLAWSQSFTFCTRDQGSRNADDLNPFYDEVAREIRRRVEQFLLQ